MLTVKPPQLLWATLAVGRRQEKAIDTKRETDPSSSGKYLLSELKLNWISVCHRVAQTHHFQVESETQSF